jgi:hypothetical protein
MLWRRHAYRPPGLLEDPGRGDHGRRHVIVLALGVRLTPAMETDRSAAADRRANYERPPDGCGTARNGGAPAGRVRGLTSGARRALLLRSTARELTGGRRGRPRSGRPQPAAGGAKRRP